MNKPFSFKERRQNLESMSKNQYDLIIIGGGIIGAGVARDAASRGMKVALIEKQDFAQGTSSRSSKLIHGGIRYLENLEFGLVFEALSERAKLFEIAPNLVHPLRFILPVYKNSRVGMFKLGLGMWLYDLLALFQSDAHERLQKDETLERLSILTENDLCGSYVYSDAYMDDDRMVLETLRSAHEMGAHIANFVEATGATKENNKVTSVVAKDVLTDKKIEIRGHHVISCVGPWTDLFAPKIVEDWKNILRPTKGIHITLQKNRLPLQDAVVMASDKENRIVFGIPRHEMVIIGTTDTDYKDIPDNVSVTKDDVEYLLKIANEYFSGAKLTEADIVSSYAGVRPLVKDESHSEGKTSREHAFLSDPSGVTFIAGGKYTTYRLIAEQAVSLALKEFTTEQRVKFSNNNTTVPLNPLASVDNMHKALSLTEVLSKNSHLSIADIEFLIRRHGLEIESLIEYAKNDRLSVWEIEVHHAVQHTMCLNLVDYYTRRTPLFLAETDHGLKHLNLLALHMQNELGWSDSEREQQKKAVQSYIQKEMQWRSNS